MKSAGAVCHSFSVICTEQLSALHSCSDASWQGQSPSCVMRGGLADARGREMSGDSRRNSMTAVISNHETDALTHLMVLVPLLCSSGTSWRVKRETIQSAPIMFCFSTLPCLYNVLFFTQHCGC